ncbi:hypothetical protein STSP2_02274 [Anaerohalosphaera lusitana]|uniref:Uncharacterized protein n=1 Tax=Anaerohalosphaera lusitana TaxID=1936003 RepID=A0A1U9NMQ9_9BACT|nr:hypothetical protein STSP2_02274 [Anaerohalosphaera lusitana]
MNHVMRRRKPRLMSKAESLFILLSVQALPASGLYGIRRKAWRDLMVGACGERENLSFRCQGRSTSGYNHECESTDADHRGGTFRSSDESFIMRWKRRECLIRSYCSVNRKRKEQNV